MIAAMRGGDPSGNVRGSEYAVRIDPDNAGRRRLSWTPERSTGVLYHVLFDAAKVGVSDTTEIVLKQSFLYPRVTVEEIETSPQNEFEYLLHVATEPDNRGRCSWAAVDGAVRYKLYRKLSGGSYGRTIYDRAAVQDQAEYTFTDFPLPDGTYFYKLVSENAFGATTEDEESIIIATVPDAPGKLSGSWNPTTHVFSITWAASASADLDHYAIRHNGGSGSIRIDDAAEDTTALLTWSIDLTAATGEYEFLIRSVDGDANEEQNLARIIAISVINGVEQGTPSAPTRVNAESIGDGKARVSFQYWPSREQGFSTGGYAKEARIYYDGGSGVMDWGTVIATVTMDFPTDPDSYEWESGVLANDTYLFGVRIATDVDPNGIETTNDDTAQVTTDTAVPAATDLVVEVA